MSLENARLLKVRSLSGNINLHVYQDIKTSKRYVLKRTKTNREQEFLKKLDHPHIIKMFMAHDKFFYMEYIPLGDLLEWINMLPTDPTTEEMRSVTKQMFSVLVYLKKQEIVHRDIKPDNILYIRKSNNSMHLKLIDFGLACHFDELPGLFSGTARYLAPETALVRTYSYQSDLFSLGITLHNLALRADAIFEATEDILKNIGMKKMNYNFVVERMQSNLIDAGKNKNFISLIKEMTRVDPRERITIEDASFHKFITSSA